MSKLLDLRLKLTAKQRLKDFRVGFDNDDHFTDRMLLCKKQNPFAMRYTASGSDGSNNRFVSKATFNNDTRYRSLN